MKQPEKKLYVEYPLIPCTYKHCDVKGWDHDELPISKLATNDWSVQFSSLRQKSEIKVDLVNNSNVVEQCLREIF